MKKKESLIVHVDEETRAIIDLLQESIHLSMKQAFDNSIREVSHQLGQQNQDLQDDLKSALRKLEEELESKLKKTTQNALEQQGQILDEIQKQGAQQEAQLKENVGVMADRFYQNVTLIQEELQAAVRSIQNEMSKVLDAQRQEIETITARVDLLAERIHNDRKERGEFQERLLEKCARNKAILEETASQNRTYYEQIMEKITMGQRKLWDKLFRKK